MSSSINEINNKSVPMVSSLNQQPQPDYVNDSTTKELLTGLSAILMLVLLMIWFLYKAIQGLITSVNSSYSNGYGFFMCFSILFIFVLYIGCTELLCCVNFRSITIFKLKKFLNNLWSTCYLSF
ncbi:unnamed protein product [Rotaria magnacalcarata]|uniref:Uncharacterized protein n=1 Tax=Rotaria magnacalcarata TaxID=392030 RepID=A0A816ZVB9_9BILA|nr:unnamed protein product [Rotaria magnacalcarata]